MTVSSAEFLKGFYNTTQSLGQKSNKFDAVLVIEGYDNLRLLTKQFPWPRIGPSGVIAFPGSMGMVSVEPQKIETHQQGLITFQEPIDGAAHKFMHSVVVRGGKFQATVYQGAPEAFYRGNKIVDAFFVPDQPAHNFENKSVHTLITGTLVYHFFNESLPGNIVV